MRGSRRIYRHPAKIFSCDDVAKVAAQCSVRLPVALCAYGRIDSLIAALEEGCGTEAAYWQESPWLAGKLALFLHEDAEKHLSSDELCGYGRESADCYGCQG